LTTGLRAEWQALRRFLAAPRRLPRRHPAGRVWVTRSVAFAAAVLVVNITLAAIVLGPLAGWAGIHEELPDRLTLRFALLGGVFAPLFEELLVRAGLRRLDYTLFAGPPLIALAFTPGGAAWTLAAGALACVMLAAWLVQRWRWREPATRIASGRRFIRHYRWVYWGYVLSFALAHLGNYTWAGATRGSAVVAAALVAMVLPQLLMGTVAGYLRLRDGLRSSVLMHFVNNAVALMLWEQL
jgi:hypothetical protein